MQVVEYEASQPMYDKGHPDNWQEPYIGTMDFVIKDRKGYLAKWLERKLTDADIDRIKVEVEAAYIQEAYDDF